VTEWLVPVAESGARLDAALTRQFPEYSRARLQEWIRAERILIYGRPAKASRILKGGEIINVEPANLTPLKAEAEEIPLKILYEDDDLVAVDKPAGMVVHAGAGVHSGTLVNALLHHFAQLSRVGGDLRPGIVHRLDRFTSGVMLVAKHDRAHRALAEQFAARKTRKIYLTLVNGTVTAASGRIDKPISRDPVRRERMTTRLTEGRVAWSEYRVLQRFAKQTLLEVLIGTGRTHQIRVHLASIGHAVVGDRLYGAPPSELGRYFLHAHSIQFWHPSTEEPVTVTSPLAPELMAWLDGTE
jgi:23S rRNA pseudouridine1911/1915/1917 synthase